MSELIFPRGGCFAQLSPSLTLVLLACACSSSPKTDPKAKAIFTECMNDFGVEVLEATITEDDVDIILGEHKLPKEELLQALETCEAEATRGLEGTAPTPFDGLSADTYQVQMRDGIHLATDVYLPEGKGPFPVVLFRTPYGKDEDGSPFTSKYLESDIAVVVQDLRGRFSSEGVDRVFTSEGDGELQDGYDTFVWLEKQPFCNGRIMTEGISASAITSYMQLAAQPPGLRGAIAYVGTPNLYDAILQGGVFRESLIEGWLEEQHSLHFLEEIYAHPFDDDFWRSSQLKYSYDRVEVPAFHVSGWFDVFLQNSIDGFVGLQKEGAVEAREGQKLVIGPWSHADDEPIQGDLEFPENARDAPIGINAIHAAFATHVLRLSEPLNLDDDVVNWNDVPPVQYYVMGASGEKDAPGHEWRSAETWPPSAAPARFYLQEEGALREACPSGGTSSYDFDPTDPAPTVCGNNLLLNTGPCEQSEVEQREDTLTFTTEPLTESMEVTGHLRGHFFLELNQPDTDLIVKVSDVYPDGQSFLLTEGAARVAARNNKTLSLVEPGEEVELDVDLQSTSIVLNTGHRLRVTVSSSNAPRYRVNYNNGQPLGADPGEPRTVSVRLKHEPQAASYVEIPRPDLDRRNVVICGTK